MKSGNHIRTYFDQVKRISDLIDKNKIEQLVSIISRIKIPNHSADEENVILSFDIADIDEEGNDGDDDA